MLVLTRKVGEKIIIGDVSVIVLKVEANRVSIGIDAPRHISIDREEIKEPRQPSGLR